MTQINFPFSEKLSQYLTKALPEPPLDVDELRAHIDQKMIDLKNYSVFETAEGVSLVDPQSGHTIDMVPAPEWDLPKEADITIHPEQPKNTNNDHPERLT